MQNEVIQEKFVSENFILIAEWCLHVPLTTGPPLLRKASPYGQFQICPGVATHHHPQLLTIIPRVPGSLGPGVGSVATTAIMANVPTFPWTLEEVWRCLLCPWNRAIGSRIRRETEGATYLLLPSLMVSPSLGNSDVLSLCYPLNNLRSVTTTSGETEGMLRFIFLQSQHSFQHPFLLLRSFY